MRIFSHSVPQDPRHVTRRFLRGAGLCMTSASPALVIPGDTEPIDAEKELDDEGRDVPTRRADLLTGRPFSPIVMPFH